MDRRFPERAAALIESAGYGDGDRVVVGLRQGDAPPVYVSRGPDPFPPGTTPTELGRIDELFAGRESQPLSG